MVKRLSAAGSSPPPCEITGDGAVLSSYGVAPALFAAVLTDRTTGCDEAEAAGEAEPDPESDSAGGPGLSSVADAAGDAGLSPS